MKENDQQYLRVKDLISRFIKSELTNDEQTELEYWIGLDKQNQKLFEELSSENNRLKELRIFRRYDEQAALSKFLKNREQDNIIQLRKRSVWKYAAAVIFMLLSTGGYFLLQKKPAKQIAQIQTQDLMPGSNKAILTISNGNKITLSGAKNGTLAVQGNIAVKKTADGHVSYLNGSGAVKETKLIYNTLTVPRGGKYNLTLADGTKVWLDAASSITYPVVFTGTDRAVQITGQAYFEVAHNTAKPFRVMVKGLAIEDIGTQFNVNAYDDEPDVKTTLLEGAVTVSKGNHTNLLKPGQQSITYLNNNSILIKEADTEEATAWKDGHFHFNKADIPAVMRQLARWYDVKVEYQGKIPEKAISGDIDRNSKASVALQILTILNVNYKIEDKKIIITP